MENTSVSKKLTKKEQASLTSKQLSTTQLEKAKNLANSFDLTKDDGISNFGLDTMKKMGDTSSKMLEFVKTKNTGDSGAGLALLVEEMGKMDVDYPAWKRFMSKLPIIGSAFNQVSMVLKNHETVDNNIAVIVNQLDKERLNGMKNNAYLQQLKGETMEFIMENKVNIEALEIVKSRLENEEIPELEKYIKKNPDDDLKIQELSDKKSDLNRLDKKCYNLRARGTNALQSINRISLIQAGNHQNNDNIQDSILLAIPLWKEEIAMELILIDQKRASDNNKMVTDKVNSIIENNATRTKENILEIARQAERGIIDIKTLRKSNTELNSAITGVLKIQKEGSVRRQEAIYELEQIEKDLISGVLNNHVDTTTVHINASETEDIIYENLDIEEVS
ncbi:MAG: hypothetical protein RL308_3417, partial [Bacteroidota bacterium]